MKKDNENVKIVLFWLKFCKQFTCSISLGVEQAVEVEVRSLKEATILGEHIPFLGVKLLGDKNMKLVIEIDFNIKMFANMRRKVVFKVTW